LVFGNPGCNNADAFESGFVFIKPIKIIVRKKGAKKLGKRENVFKNIFENKNYWLKR